MDEGLPDALAAALRPKYRLRRRLGEGGMGSVYLAEEVALGRDVAVKLLSPVLARDEQFRIRFQHEARAAAGLQLDNVVQVYTVGEVPGRPPIPYIILQYVEGTSLEALLEEQGPLPELRARRLLREGVIRGRIVAVLTGHLLKDPASVAPSHPVEIEPVLTAVEQALHS